MLEAIGVIALAVVVVKLFNKGSYNNYYEGGQKTSSNAYQLPKRRKKCYYIASDGRIYGHKETRLEYLIRKISKEIKKTKIHHNKMK